MVIDFGNIKKTIGNWIDENWDHKTLVHKDDSELLDFLKEANSAYHIIDGSGTAEWMSQFLYHKAQELLCIFRDENSDLVPTSVRVSRIQVWETADSFSEFSLS